jgi:hypothetical protein
MRTQSRIPAATTRTDKQAESPTSSGPRTAAAARGNAWMQESLLADSREGGGRVLHHEVHVLEQGRWREPAHRRERVVGGHHEHHLERGELDAL